MENFICQKCFYSPGNFKLKIKIIPTGRPAPYPKWIPSIKVTCNDCNTFVKFAKQEDSLIDAFNNKLDEISINILTDDEIIEAAKDIFEND